MMDTVLPLLNLGRMWQQPLPNSLANLQRTERKSAVSNPTAYHSRSSDPAYLQQQHQTHSPLARTHYLPPPTHTHRNSQVSTRDGGTPTHGIAIHRGWASGSSTPASWRLLSRAWNAPFLLVWEELTRLVSDLWGITNRSAAQVTALKGNVTTSPHTKKRPLNLR